MDLGANGNHSAAAPAADTSVADSSAEAEVMAANNDSVETEQSFLEDADEERPTLPKGGMEKSEIKEGNEEPAEEGLSSQDEDATSQEEDEGDEEVILNRGANALTVMDMRECPKLDGVTVVRPRILKAEDAKGEDKENVAEQEGDEDDDDDEEEEEEVNEGEEGQEDDEDKDEEEDDEDDPLVAGALAAKANGSVNEWVNYLDETDPCHRLRSLCKKGDIEGLAKLLESKNSDVEIDSVSEEGWTSLHEIITHECQFTEVARVLLRFGANVNTQDLHRDSPLHSALLYHNLDNISLLLANEADQRLINQMGRMPVHVADEVDTLALLLEHDPTLADAQDRIGNTPLHYAVAARDRERVFLLLKYKADANLANRQGTTPLHLTMDSEVAARFLEVGADPNQPDSLANTPLHSAVKRRLKDIVRIMIEKKADTSLANAGGKTPLNLAKDKEMKNILLGRGPPPSSSERESGGGIKKVKKVAAAAADVAAAAAATTTSSASASAGSGGNSSSSSSASASPAPAAAASSSFMDKFAESIAIPVCSSPSILKKRKRDGEEEETPKPKGPRLRFSDVNDYSGVEVVEEEKRVKVPPMYSEQVFSSDEDV